jgi:pimeloyl-ACP methyl ester carboxylesterase
MTEDAGSLIRSIAKNYSTPRRHSTKRKQIVRCNWGMPQGYGTGDIAQDTEAVRAALGYNKVDYDGGSYGGADVTAYATRFGEHLRSIVLDAPVGAPDLKPFRFERYKTQAIPRIVRLACLRSPICSIDHPNADAELDWLIFAIRLHPVEGDTYDASGKLVHVRLDEEALLNFIIANPTGNFASTDEVPAAGTALSQGDPAPLLRLGAEGTFPLLSDSGDLTFFSAGDHYATVCADFHFPWDGPHRCRPERRSILRPKSLYESYQQLMTEAPAFPIL